MADLDFELCPGFSFERDGELAAVQSPAAVGFVQRRTIFDRTLRRFLLRFPYERTDLLEEIERRFDEAIGPVRAMNFTPPDSVDELEVQFEEDALTRIFDSHVVGQCEFRLVEVL